jgi:hypothetical protein
MRAKYLLRYSSNSVMVAAMNFWFSLGHMAATPRALGIGVGITPGLAGRRIS